MAAEVTGRAIVDGKAVSLRSVQNAVAKSHKRNSRATVDLLAISGSASDEGPMQADAMVLLSFLGEGTLTEIVSELGQRGTSRPVGKYRQEEEALQSHLGPTALRDLQRLLKRGR